MINFSKEQMYNTINTIASEELNLETARKIIASLVVENANMQKRIYKAIEKLEFYNNGQEIIDILKENEVRK